MPLSSTVVMHKGHKDTLKVQILVTYFRNTKSKSLSGKIMKLYFRKYYQATLMMTAQFRSVNWHISTTALVLSIFLALSDLVLRENTQK